MVVVAMGVALEGMGGDYWEGAGICRKCIERLPPRVALAWRSLVATALHH